jgi:predicted transcriptional regulator
MLSELQHRILLHLEKVKRGTYNTLVDDIQKDRVTIWQSIMPLIEYHFVWLEQEDMKRQKSRFYFGLTKLGELYISNNLHPLI